MSGYMFVINNLFAGVLAYSMGLKYGMEIGFCTEFMFFLVISILTYIIKKEEMVAELNARLIAAADKIQQTETELNKTE